MAQTHQKAVNDLLGSFYVAYSPVLAKIFGQNEALLLGLLLYWHGKGEDPNWVYKTSKEIEEQTSLTSAQQKLAIKNLKATPYFKQIRAGNPATRHFKLNFDQLINDLPSLAKSANLDELIQRNKKVFSGRTIYKRIQNDIHNKTHNNSYLSNKARAGPEDISAILARRK